MQAALIYLAPLPRPILSGDALHPVGSGLGGVEVFVGRERGVLLPWNPMFEPEAIRVHVEGLRASADRAVWWGRIAIGRTEEYTWKPIREAFELMQERTTERPVLVTDFVRLHALRVDAVSMERPTSGVPDYYGSRPVGLWFRVRDVRVLSHDQVRTLEFLRTEIGTGKHPEANYFFDPYASFLQVYPRLIWGPTAAEFFPKEGAPASGHYSDAKDVIDRPITEDAYRRLGEVWGSGAWGRLTPFSRESLALADAAYRDERYGLVRRKDADPAPVLLHLVRALERELIHELLAPLVERAKNGPQSSPLAELRPHFGDLKWPLTLGALTHVNQGRFLADWSKRVVGEGALTQLLATPEWRSWLGALRHRRNNTLHAGESATAGEVRALAKSVLDGQGDKPARVLDTITAAKAELRERVLHGDV